jgi:hypothetical protein
LTGLTRYSPLFFILSILSKKRKFLSSLDYEPKIVVRPFNQQCIFIAAGFIPTVILGLTIFLLQHISLRNLANGKISLREEKTWTFRRLINSTTY